MPVITVCVSKKLEPPEKNELALAAVDAVADGMKKPKEIVMSLIHDGVAMTYLNDCAPAAFAHVQSIGPIPAEARRSTVKLLCTLLKEYGIDPTRTLVRFEESGKSDWGIESIPERSLP